MASPERKKSVVPMPTTPTPSEWPASQPGPRHRQGVPKMDVEFEHDNELEPADVLIPQEMAASDDRQPTSPSKPSSHLSAPTPAQRSKPLSPSAPGNRKKRRIDVEESGSGVSGPVSTSAGNVCMSDSRQEKVSNAETLLSQIILIQIVFPCLAERGTTASA